MSRNTISLLHVHIGVNGQQSNNDSIAQCIVLIMHLSFASPVPGYPGTSKDRCQTHSLEADKFPSNIRRLPRRAGHLRYWITNKVPALMPGENADEVPAQIPSPNDHHQATAATPYMFPACRDVTIPALSWRVSRYCLGTQGPEIQMIGA